MKHYAWIKVESSNLEEVAYVPASQALLVRFKSNLRVHYIYANVTESLFNEMMAAESKGSFFARQIKSVCEFRKVEG